MGRINELQPSQPNELRLFISSTFRDMQEEREHLVKKIFPEIRSICRARGVMFTEIDLRWGLTAEEGMLGRIIRACLEEIDRCRPYFIGITGDRYGYVPTITDVHKDPVLLTHYPWVEEGAMLGMSILEMECRYGGIGFDGWFPPQPAEEGGCAYYVRTTDPAEPEEYPGDHDRLQRLKDEILQSGQPAGLFRTPEELGRQVRDHLLGVIERDFSRRGEESRLQVERRSHAAFALSRRMAYIPRSDYIRTLDQHVEPGNPPLVIYGPSGSGKSALLSFWGERYHRRLPEASLIEHYIGASSEGEEFTAILRHIMRELKEEGEIDEELPSNVDPLVRLFPSWLLAGSGDRDRTIIIDNLDGLHGAGRSLSWLPHQFPEGTHVIVSTSSRELVDALSARGWDLLELEPLTLEEREALIARFLGGYHKGLTVEQVRRIASFPHSSQPLFLRTLLEELRLFGLHEELDNEIDRFLMVESTDDLFRTLLERLEHDHDPGMVRQVMQLLWTSITGLTEPEIGKIAGLQPDELSTFLSTLDHHLFNVDGRLSFAHDYLARSVRERYIDDEEGLRELRSAIAGRMKEEIEEEEGRRTGSTLLRLYRERSEQLERAGEIESLRHLLSEPSFLLCFTGEGLLHQLLRYWVSVGGGGVMEEDYRQILEHLPSDPPQQNELLATLGQLLSQSGRYESARDVLQRLLLSRRSDRETTPDQLAIAITLLANVLNDLGDLDGAKRLYQEGLALCGREEGLESIAINSINSLAMLLRREHNPDAEDYFREGYQRAAAEYGPDDPRTATGMNNLGVMLQSEGRLDEAEALLEGALAIRRRSLGSRHPFTGSTMHNLAYLRYLQGEYGRAEELYRSALEINRTSLGEDHPNVAECLKNLARLCEAVGRNDEAEEYYREGLAICVKAFGPENIVTAGMEFRLARLLVNRKREEGRERLERVVTIFSERHLHDYAIESCILLAEGSLEEGAIDRAAEWIDRGFDEAAGRLPVDHPLLELLEQLRSRPEVSQPPGAPATEP